MRKAREPSLVTPAVTTGPVLLDISAVQSRDYGERGVARHAMEFARALLEVAPDLVGALLLNDDLPVPDGLEALADGGRLLTRSQAAATTGGRIHHVIAPFELEQPLSALWPRFTVDQGMRLMVTLHDLIPRVFPDQYHADPGLRRRYLAREELVRAADRVLAVSETTREEAINRLGLAPRRISVIGAGISSDFVRPASRSEALARARQRVRGLEAGFLLYVGGIDHRKNLDGLLAAYALLAPGLRAAHQLVIACRLGDEQRARLASLAARLGVGGRVVLTGFVTDPVLIALYQSTELFVFPSLYEGYGLPVAEAMACGAPVVAANTSATAELADPAGQFDPADPTSIARAITLALTDPVTRTALQAASDRPAPTWAAAARRAVPVYKGLLAPPRRPCRRRLRVGFVTPLPPQRSGVAIYSERLLEALGVHAASALDIDVFVDALEGGIASLPQPPRPPAGVSAVHPVEHRDRVEAARGGYDVMVYAIGNSEFHTGALGAVLRRPGIVLAHDVALPQLYAFAAHHGVLPADFRVLFGAMYPDAANQPPDPLLVDPAELNALPQPMVRDVIAASSVFLTTSSFAADLARQEARPGDEARIGVLTHAGRVIPPRPQPGTPGELVASFGVVNRTKDTARLLEAFALVLGDRPGVRLALVGQASQRDLDAVHAQAERLGIAASLTATGAVDADAWDRWLSQATVAVQLRQRTNGEFSGAIAECLAFGVPTIVATLGAAGELPAAAVVGVAPTITPAELAGEIVELLDNPARREGLAGAARAWAAARSFPAIAEELFVWITRTAGLAAADANGGKDLVQLR